MYQCDIKRRKKNMSVINKLGLVGCFCYLLLGCSQLDDYLLGKDNTPKPTTLSAIKSQRTLEEKWSIAVGKPSKTSHYLKLKPVVRGNVVYVADSSGSVSAVEKNQGQLLWSIPQKRGIVSGPTVSAGYLAVGTSASTVLLLNQNNGQEIWQAKISSDSLSKPVIANQKVIVKTIDGNLYAFDLFDGKKIWVSEHGSPSLILKASSSPVVEGQNILVGFSDGKLDALTLDSGTQVWQRSIAYASGSSDVERLVDIDADPIIRGEVAYLATYQGYVGALSLTDGQFIWRKPGSTYKNLALDAQTLFMTDSDDVLWALDKKTGQVRWKQPALKARGVTEPVLMGNYLVVGDKEGYLHVLKTQNGAFVARTQLKSPIEISPAVSQQSIYVLTANGKLSHLMLS